MKLRQRLKKIKQTQKGFTLVELIVVIAIIGVLAGVMLPKYFGFTDDARRNACLSEAKTISSLIQTNYAKYGEMPEITTGDLSDPDNPSTLELTDDTEYEFNGVLEGGTNYETDGSFTYTKNNGTSSSGLYTATCDEDGNVEVNEYSEDED